MENVMRKIVKGKNLTNKKRTKMMTYRINPPLGGLISARANNKVLKAHNKGKYLLNHGIK